MSQIKKEFPIGSLLSARQFFDPKLFSNRIYFISNLIGHYSLYEMQEEGSLPIPVIPESIPLMNPRLFHGSLIYEIIPELEKILIVIDKDGNELFQPFLVPLEMGGIPENLFDNKFDKMQFNMLEVDIENSCAFFAIDDRKSPGYELIRVNLKTMDVISYGKTPNGLVMVGHSADYKKIIAVENYGPDDMVLYLVKSKTSRNLYLGSLPKDRTKEYKPISIQNAYFIENDSAFLSLSHMLSDSYGIIRFDANNPNLFSEVLILGTNHKGMGILESFSKIRENIYQLIYNIDGVSYVYIAEYITKEEKNFLKVIRQLIGLDDLLSNGVSLGIGYDKELFNNSKLKIPEKFVISLTKSLMPSQLFLINTSNISNSIEKVTQERVVGIPEKFLSEGEPANYKSFDGLEVSARLYRPSEILGYQGPRPLVVFIHGGPTIQERPDFTGFSTPIIQYLTLNGFSVFVPNVRGSTGYGNHYTSQVYRDWGGKDYQDHLAGLKILEKDPLLDSSKRFVMGRSYGGFMTLSLLTRNPDLWAGGCDMFGMYDLLGFYNRLPETWQKMMVNMMADPSKEEERKLLEDRSPKSYIKNINSPLLVIQGRNDPRILAKESEEIFNELKKSGKDVELIIYENEGHDVSKIENKIDCYQRITEFFLKYI